MKCLILKDLYNIAHNAKSLLFTLGILALAFFPMENPSGYVFVSAMICSMMTVTTFPFDEQSKWNAYALVLPVTRRSLVGAKFVILFLFSAFGSLFGLSAGVLWGLLRGQEAGNFALLLNAPVAFLLVTTVGSVTIPLLYRFGAERGRLLLVAAAIVFAAVLLGGVICCSCWASP